MVRTQIQLTEKQAEGLKRLAAERGVSMAELVRQSVQRLLEEREQDEKWQRLWTIVGKYRSNATDVAVNHDRYLYDEHV
jgi:Arc/MetJ-type ribon-helix-helix transcriptional regulator